MTPDAAEPSPALPYPPHWERQVRWQDRLITVRPIRPDDEARHRAFLSSLAPEDLRLRFFHTRREVPAAELERLTHIDYQREIAFIADDGGRTLGVVRAACDAANVEAEFAIVVRSDLKGRGLGWLLMQRLIEHLRERGTRRLVGHVLRGNEAMQRLASACGLQVDAARGEPGIECWVLDPLA